MILIQYDTYFQLMDMDSMIIISTSINKIKNDFIYYFINTNWRISKFINFFDFNKNIFIWYDQISLSLFKRVNNSKIYELLSNIEIKDIRGLIKINNTKFMIYTLIGLYEINIKNCKIKEISLYFYKGTYVDFIVKIKNNIYIYQNEILYLCKYLKDELILISCYKYGEEDAIKHLLNTVNPRIAFNIIISKKKLIII